MESCGSLGSADQETRFNEFLPTFKNSYIEKTLLQMNFPFYRTRLMRLTAKGCYSVHCDTSWRFHVPISTNEHAWLIFFDTNEKIQLEVGKVYFVNTMRPHSYMNGGTTDRIHIIGSIPWFDVNTVPQTQSLNVSSSL